MGRKGEREGDSLKTALVVAGAIAAGWLAIEMAFKPFLDSLRSGVSKSDPARDPDDDVDATTAAREDAPPPETTAAASIKEDKEEEKDREAPPSA